MAHLTLGVLGALQITLPDGSTAKLESDRARALLAYLAVRSDRAHRRDALIGLIWSPYSEETARHNLRQALFNLRKAIGDHTAKPPYFFITRDEIRFNPASRYALDLAEFEAHLAACEKHSHPRLDACAICAPRLQQAVELYRGKFLQEFFLEGSAEFEEWALTLREATHLRAVDALTHLANYYESHGDLAATRRCAARQLELDPWLEPAHRQMMRVLASEGQRQAALVQYETCRRVLAEAFGVEPSNETRELFEKIKSGDWKPDAASSKQIPREAATLQPPPSNLRLPLTPFIGRERELAELGRLVTDPECRCITLVAPGGMGKTRLAIQTAANHRNDFAQGVAFVQLATINSAEAVIPAIADALGFSFYGPTSPRVQLSNYLRDKQMLLVLDNVEQLVGDADLFVGLLEHAPEIKLLLTSREPLNVQGEWVVQVEGLQIPAGTQIEESSAAALFIQRARRTRTGFALNDQERAAVARLCRLVDGMPLALELAATWVRTLPVTEICKEIERDLDFLQAPVRDLPERHRSIRAVFDGSWKLLTAEEQNVLIRLSVFRDGFQREAAEQVAEATLSALSSLVTKSFVRRSGENRYDLHELVDQFAAEHLAERPEEQAATYTRHGIYYLSYFGQADGRVRSSAQREALAELTVEMENFRAAWAWAVTHAKFALIEQAMRVFVRLYDTRGWYQEGVATLERAVDALEMAHGHSPPDSADRVALAHLLAASAWLAYRLTNYEQAQGMLERSLEILRPLNEPHVLVESITYLGRVMEMTGNHARALELYSEGLELATTIGDRWFQAVCRTLHTALVEITQGMVQPEITYDCLQSVLADWRLIGDPRLIAFGLDFYSRSALRLGRYNEARAALEENIELNNSVGFSWGVANAYRGLGIVAQAQEDHSQAVKVFRKSLDTFTELGASWWVARVLADMGNSILALGDDAEAVRVWCEALRIATDIQAKPVALEALAGLASLRAKKGDTQSALALLFIVRDHPASLQETKNRAGILRRELEARLTPQQIESAQTQAQTPSLDRVVAEALGQLR